MIVARGLFATAAIALAACTIAPVSLDGKQCPCAPGYACDTLTNLCLATDGDGGIIDGPLANQCLGGAQSELYRYTGTFDWMRSDSSWSGAAEIVQASTQAMNSYAFTVANVPNDYRVIATMRQTTSGMGQPSMGVVLRAQPSLQDKSRYACVWAPKAGELRVQVTRGGNTSTLGSAMVANANQNAPITMEARVIDVAGAPTLSCCLREHASARIMDLADTNASPVPAGKPGLATDRMAAAFGSFVVLAP
jgi:hypothetical protein